MKDSILIKGTKDGLTILLDNDIDFSTLKKNLGEKINNAKQYFSDAKVSITFTGRSLTDIEQHELIETITNNSNMDVVCILERKLPEISNESIIDEERLDIEEDKAIFHKGTLRSGQQIEVDSSIIIMGNINPGAIVIAKGNVIVLGALKGSVYAGSDSDTSSFVVALIMKPIHIKIGNIIARASDYEEYNTKDPQIAYAMSNRICIESINKSVYKELLYI